MGCTHSAVRHNDDGVDSGATQTDHASRGSVSLVKTEEPVAMPSDPLSQRTNSFTSAGHQGLRASTHLTAPQVSSSLAAGDFNSDSLARRVLVGSLAHARSSAPTCLAPEDVAVHWLARSASKDIGFGRQASLVALHAPNDSRSSSQFPLVPCARSNSIDRRMSSIELSPRVRPLDESGFVTSAGTNCVKETDRMVVDQVKDNVFINQYLIIKDLGKGAYGTVKLVYNTEDDMLYAMKVVTQKSWPSRADSCQPLPLLPPGNAGGHQPSRHSSARSGPLASFASLLNTGPRTPSARSMAVPGHRDSDTSVAGMGMGAGTTGTTGQQGHFGAAHQGALQGGGQGVGVGGGVGAPLQSTLHGGGQGGGLSVCAPLQPHVSGLVSDSSLAHAPSRLGDSYGGGAARASSGGGTPGAGAQLPQSFSMTHAASTGSMGNAGGNSGPSALSSWPLSGAPAPGRSRSGKSLLGRTTSRLAVTQSAASDGSQADADGKRDSGDRGVGASVAPGIAPVAEEVMAPTSVEAMAAAASAASMACLERLPSVFSTAGSELLGSPARAGALGGRPLSLPGRAVAAARQLPGLSGREATGTGGPGVSGSAGGDGLEAALKASSSVDAATAALAEAPRGQGPSRLVAAASVSISQPGMGAGGSSSQLSRHLSSLPGTGSAGTNGLLSRRMTGLSSSPRSSVDSRGNSQSGESGRSQRTCLQLPEGLAGAGLAGEPCSGDLQQVAYRSQLRLPGSGTSSGSCGAAAPGSGGSGGPHSPTWHGGFASGAAAAAAAGVPCSSPLAGAAGGGGIGGGRPLLLGRAGVAGSSRFGADQTNPSLLGSSNSLGQSSPGSDSPLSSPVGLRPVSPQPGPSGLLAPVSSRLSSYSGAAATAAGGTMGPNSAGGFHVPLSRQQTGAFAQLGAHYCSEMAVMKDLDHPNVVKLYEVISSQADRKVLMVMEYVEGGCVMPGSHPIKKDPIPESVALGYFRDVVQGLDYLHFNGVAHGDIKPDNLLLTISAKVKITDFGSARLCEPDEMLVKSVGTPAFMAPEMCAGQPFNGFKGDVWALGVCLYLFIFGCTPFSGQSSYQVYEAVQKQPLAFLPGKAGSEASAEVKHLISRLLEKDPARRATLEEVATHPWVTRAGTLPLLTCKDLAMSRVLDVNSRRRSAEILRTASGRGRGVGGVGVGGSEVPLLWATASGSAAATPSAAAAAVAATAAAQQQQQGSSFDTLPSGSSAASDGRDAGSGGLAAGGMRFATAAAAAAAPASPRGNRPAQQLVQHLQQQLAAAAAKEVKGEEGDGDGDETLVVVRSAKSTSALRLSAKHQRLLAPPQLGFGTKKGVGGAGGGGGAGPGSGASAVPPGLLVVYSSSSQGGSGAPDGDDSEAALTAKLLQLLPGSQRRVFENGQHLIKLGEPCEGLFLLLDGSCDLIRSAAQRKAVADDDFADRLDDDDDPHALSSELQQAVQVPSGNVEFSLDYLRASVQVISPAVNSYQARAGGGMRARPGTPMAQVGPGESMEDLLVLGYGSRGGDQQALDEGDEDEGDEDEPMGAGTGTGVGAGAGAGRLPVSHRQGGAGQVGCYELAEDSIDLSIPATHITALATGTPPPLPLRLQRGGSVLVPPSDPLTSLSGLAAMPDFARRSASVPLLHVLVPDAFCGSGGGGGCSEPQSPTTMALLMGTGGGLGRGGAGAGARRFSRGPVSTSTIIGGGSGTAPLSPVLPRSRYASAALPSIHDSATLQADTAGVEALSSYVAASLKLPSVVVDSGRIQRAMVRSDSMQKRMDELVRRAKPYASTQVQQGNKMLVCHRGPGSVLGDVCVDGRRPRPSTTAVIARGRVVALLIPHSLTWKRSAVNPVVRAALNRSANAQLVQEAMERFVECESEVHFARRVRDHAAAGLRNVLADSRPASPRFGSSNSLLQDAHDPPPLR